MSNTSCATYLDNAVIAIANIVLIQSTSYIRPCLISQETLLFTPPCQAVIVHQGPLHFTMAEVAENHPRTVVQDQNFRLARLIQMPFILDRPFNR